MSLKALQVSIISLIVIITGCEIINPKEKIPSYIYISDFSFTCNLDAQGYPSSKITDAWVYAGNDFIGAFELPATVPILTSGETDIIIYAGIKENGISGTGMIYPFYNGFTVTRNLIEGATDTIYPTTTYKPSTAITFLFIERFEIGNAFESVVSDVNLTTTTSPTDVFEGIRSAVTSLTSDLDTFRVGTSDVLFFPTIDHQLFLELDYKCDIPYNVWLRCNSVSGSTVYDEILTITPKEDWNKIYINLNPSLQFFSSFQPESYNLELRSYNTSGDSASIFYDNIKIIQSN